MTGHFPHQAVKLVAGDGYLERHHVADVLRDALASGHVQAFTREELEQFKLRWGPGEDIHAKARSALDAMEGDDG